MPGQTVETVLFIGRVSAFFHHSLHAQSGREVAKNEVSALALPLHSLSTIFAEYRRQVR